jgi:dihydrofolate reductase
MAAHWTTAQGENDEIARFMNTVPKYVFSRTLDRADWTNTTLVQDDAVAAVTQLKQEPGGDLFVFGSADLSATLIRHGLYDEYRIGLVPGTLGTGTPLFKQDTQPRRMELVESRALGHRCQLVRYKPAPAAGSTR